MLARNTQPPSTGSAVTSVTHTSLGLVATKFLSSRFGARCSVKRLSVVPRKARRGRATRPISCMTEATIFSETTSPCCTRASRTRGLPYVRREDSCTAATFFDSSSRRFSLSEGPRLRRS
jgi:hypothetical protein